MFENLEKKIGNTKLIEFEKNIYFKLENENFTGSMKDRSALEMIKDYYSQGLINKETIIVCPSSGNLGISVAAICKELNLQCIILMSKKMSIKRREFIKKYNAILFLFNPSIEMKDIVKKAKQIVNENNNYLLINQFDNYSNVKAHYKTGEEIYRQLKGKIDIFVCGIGSGGSISGIGKYLKDKNHNIKIIGVEPSNSSTIKTGKVGTHNIQGIGAGFIPEILNLKVIDDIVLIDEDELKFYKCDILKSIGISVGFSSIANFIACKKIKEKYGNDKVIVSVLHDSGDRY